MITLHHLNSSRSQRVLWLLEELGVEYEVRQYQRDPGTLRAPPELQAVHFLGKSPTITDGDRTLAESGAIVEYLVHRYGAGRLAPPADAPERARYTYWLHYAEGSAILPLVLRLIFRQMPRQPMPALARPIVRALARNVIETFVEPQIERHLDYMDGELTRSSWFAGDEFTAADIQMSFPVQVAAMRGGIERSHPRLWTYLQRIHARPAYERALAKGGPYDLADLGAG
jgi:glutathione S-transferase